MSNEQHRQMKRERKLGMIRHPHRGCQPALLGLLLLCACQAATISQEGLVALDTQRFEQRKDQFEAEQAAAIAEANTAVRAEFDRREAAVDPDAAARAALYEEAAALLARYPGASETEQRRLEQRARELSAQVEALQP
jgi:hypothetical protein